MNICFLGRRVCSQLHARFASSFTVSLSSVSPAPMTCCQVALHAASGGFPSRTKKTRKNLAHELHEVAASDGISRHYNASKKNTEYAFSPPVLFSAAACKPASGERASRRRTRAQIPGGSFLFGFFGFLDLDLALHNGQMGALRWICW